MARAKAQTAALSQIEAEYPNQYKRMVGFLESRGIPVDDIHDLIQDAWLQARETFDASRGLAEIQWAWWVLQHNMLPGYHRVRAKQREDRLPHEPRSIDDSGDSNEGANQARELILFLQMHLKGDVLDLFRVLLQIKENTGRLHIFKEVSQRLNIPMKECRNRMKRLRRACHSLRSQWEEQQ